MTPCEQVGAFFDGQLPAHEAAAFRAHLSGCAPCQREIRAAMLLATVEEQHIRGQRPKTSDGAAPARPTGVISLTSRRRPRHLLLTALGALAVAATAVLLVRRPPEPILLATARRPIEPRLSYVPADRYRPYDVARGSRPPGGEVPLTTLAELERNGDLHGVAAGYLLAGERARAAPYLERAGASLDVVSDQAVMALLGLQPEEALRLADSVLAKQPGHAQATWNRALALGQLDLGLAAAEAFDRVAGLGEPGWSEEARARAAALRRDADERKASWDRGRRAGVALVRSGALPADDLVRAQPGLCRHYLYHALRTAPSRERVLSLLPLGEALDRSLGGSRMAALVRATALRPRPEAALRDTYAGLVTQTLALDASHQDAYLAQLRRKGARDLLLSAIVVLGRERRMTELLAELAQAAADPWFGAIAAGAQADALLARGEPLAAERRLLAALAECTADHADYRCVDLEQRLANLYLILFRMDAARTHAREGLRRARQAVSYRASVFLFPLAEVARGEGDFSLMRAYLRESELERPEECTVKRAVHELSAVAHLFQLEPAAARSALDRAPRCDAPITLARADVLASLARRGLGGEEAAGLGTDLEALRPTLEAGLRAHADVILGRWLALSEPARGGGLMRQALVDTEALPAWDADAAKARAYAHVSLALEAARQQDAPGVLGALAAQAGVPVPARCVLALAVDEERAAAAWRGADGSPEVHFEAVRPSPALIPAALVPARARAALAGCSTVAVLSPPPLHGMPRLLPPDLAWSYRSGGAEGSQAQGLDRRVVVSDVEPPATLGLPRLGPWSATTRDAVRVAGAAATPARVLAELADASEAQIHAHGLVALGLSEASFLALSPDAQGRYELTAGQIRQTHLRGRPVIVLGACHAARPAGALHVAWSLPDALLAAGARAVIASSAPIPDAEASSFFEAVLARIRAGSPPAAALRDERRTLLSRDPDGWAQDLMVFDTP